VFPYSKGTKKFIFQDIIKNTDKYYYLLLDGKMKTNLYNKGVLDGAKKPLPLFEYRMDLVPEEKWILAIPKFSVHSDMINENEKYFVGRIGIVKTYILKSNSIGTFLEYSCSLTECQYDGKKDCFNLNEFDCSLPNRKRHAAGRYSYA
jgi:hypothetical protein